MTKWRNQYPHERKWKAADPSQPTTPYPPHDDTLTDIMRRYLEGRDLSYPCAHRAGWYPAEHYGPRIIIPCIRSDGGLWWQARTMSNHPKRWLGSHGYKHDAVCFVPGHPKNMTVIVEGPMDALAAASLGYPAIAILGATPPAVVYDHVARLVGFSYRKGMAIIIPDMDRIAEWQATQQELGQRGVNGSLRAIAGYKDLADMPVDTRRDFLDTA